MRIDDVRDTVPMTSVCSSIFVIPILLKRTLILSWTITLKLATHPESDVAMCDLILK